MTLVHSIYSPLREHKTQTEIKPWKKNNIVLSYSPSCVQPLKEERDILEIRATFLELA